MRLQLFLISSALAFFPAAAHALVKVSADDPSELAVLGEISPFDAITFEWLANDQEQHGHPIRSVKFDSRGGDIGLALKIAENIERRGLDTRVAPGGLCASVCVLPLAAGKHVRIGVGAQVGVHQARTAQGGEEWGGSYSMAAFLASHHVAHSVTVKLIDTPHDGKAWLTTAEMRESGWTVEQTAPANVMPGASFDLDDIRQALDRQKVQPAAAIITSHHEVSCAGNGSRLSFFQVASMSDGPERVFVSGSDLGSILKDGQLSRTCGSIPAGTKVAGQWEAQTPAAPIPTLGSTPVPPAEIVAVPRRADLAPSVIPAPVEAAPQQPTAPAMFRPLPEPANLPRTAQRGKCSMLTMAGVLPVGMFEGGCLIERANDASLRITIDQPGAKPAYFFPNGPSSMLFGDGVSFFLDRPLTVSSDRTCMKNADGSFQVCATVERPATILDGVNGLFADLFGSAVRAERRLGLLGE